MRKKDRKRLRKHYEAGEKFGVADLKLIADDYFSEYIRKRDKCICFTCGTHGDFSSMQAGHYVKRSINSLRYAENNVHCQCQACNIMRYGNMDEYALALIGRYGEGILESLAEKKRELHQFTVKELEALIGIYREKLEQMSEY